MVIVERGAVRLSFFAFSGRIAESYIETAIEIKGVYPVSALRHPPVSDWLTLLQDKPVTIVQGSNYLLTDIYPPEISVWTLKVGFVFVEYISSSITRSKPRITTRDAIDHPKGKIAQLRPSGVTVHSTKKDLFVTSYTSDNSTRSGSKHFPPPKPRSFSADWARIRESFTNSSTPIPSFNIHVGRYHGSTGS